MNGNPYDAAGVHVAAGERVVEMIRRAQTSHRPEVRAGIGGFAGVFELAEGTQLVSSCDGVGTKVLIAAALSRWDTIGIDVVAMSVNDILTLGAEPLFFLDYVAVGALVPEQVAQVVAGVDWACRAVGAVLLGGETAEMPGLYAPEHLDLAGFVVGRTVSDRAVPPPVRPGQHILGLASNGLHSNGYTLVRQLTRKHGIPWTAAVPGSGVQWADEALRPTRLYVEPVLSVIRRFPVAAMAHITGGGLVGNLPRVLNGFGARVDPSAWPEPPVFRWLADLGQLRREDLFSVFNDGIGYCLVVEEEFVAPVLDALARLGERAWDIGRVTEQPGVAWA